MIICRSGCVLDEDMSGRWRRTGWRCGRAWRGIRGVIYCNVFLSICENLYGLFRVIIIPWEETPIFTFPPMHRNTHSFPFKTTKIWKLSSREVSGVIESGHAISCGFS